MRKTAKEIWKTLLITHQGNSQVKDNKIDLLVQQYEKFTIPKEESIDNAFARFNTIITSLKALDECFSSKNCVLGLANGQTWESILNKTYGVKKPTAGSGEEQEKGERKIKEPASNKLCGSDEVLKLKNFKKDDYTSFQDQEKYEHVGPKVTSTQEGKISQDDDKRLYSADDLKKFKDHTQVKLKGTSSSLKSKDCYAYHKLKDKDSRPRAKTEDIRRMLNLRFCKLK
ncbi:hypothetical protein Tco_0609468 [Tanacetum coccineum]